MLLQISATCCSKHLKKVNWRNKVLLQTSARCCYKHLELVNWRNKVLLQTAKHLNCQKLWPSWPVKIHWTDSGTETQSSSMSFSICVNGDAWIYPTGDGGVLEKVVRIKEGLPVMSGGGLTKACHSDSASEDRDQFAEPATEQHCHPDFPFKCND